MRSLSALFIIGFVAAGSLEPYSWTPSQEYKYKYTTQVFTGIPELNNQFSGLRLTSTVRIQPRQDSTLRIQLENPRLNSYNEKIEWDPEYKPTQSGQEEQIPSHIKTWLETPFTVYHKRGLVEKILIENGEPEFVVNIKKGLVSQVQINLSQTRDSRQNQIRDEHEILPVFKTHEASAVGKCETEYTISKLPAHMIIQLKENELVRDSVCEGKDHYEIIKTKNLENCSTRPLFHKSVGLWSKNAETQSNLPTQSAVTRTIICGSLQNHYIRKSTTENNILMPVAGEFESKEKIDVSVYSTLYLESVERSQNEIPEPSSPKGYPSLVYEYPSGSSSSSSSLKKEVLLQNNNQLQQQLQDQMHAPLPDLTSAPVIFHMKGSSQRELKQKAIEVITEMMEYAGKLEESSKSKRDVAGLSVSATKFLSMLSLEELKEVEQAVISQGQRHGQHSLIRKAFFDLVSIAGTNPCLMLIKEKITSGEINQEPASWSWIISNALRSVQTPTPELLKELVQLAKSENVQKNRIIRAAYLMGLTNLINKACVNPESKQNQFPYRIYGEMCNKESSVIKGDLIPYLTQKLQEASRENMNSVITYVNALGNIGTEETSQELLKVVEGKIRTNPYPRSVAVYKLIRPAMLNPTLYRPIFLSLIENSAEDPIVRMAAVTAIPYTAPSSADLQKLALRTWFEPSRQVSSYIYSTLKSLSQLTDSIPIYESIKNKAKIILPLAKPAQYGWQYSQNLQFTTFVESLKTAVSHKLQWTASEESFIPRTIYAKAELKAHSRNADAIETMFYLQGAETVTQKLYDLYSNFEYSKDSSRRSQFEREAQEIIGKVGIQEKHNIKPEAHMNLKFMGMEKLYSIDEDLVQKIVSSFSSDVMENMEALERGLKTEYFKILDLSSSEFSIPTESGIAVQIFTRMPTVAYNEAKMKVKRMSRNQPTLEVEMKGVTNYKRHVQAGVMCAITNKFFAAGVETSMHIAVPLKAEVTIRRGQVQVSVQQLEEPEYQREQQLIELDAHPYTTTHNIKDITLVSKSRHTKTIHSHQPIIKREVNVGRPLGLDVKVEYESEESSIDVYKLWEDLKTNVPVFLASLPTPITTGRRTSIKVYHNPSNSQVKELDFYLSADIASKLKNMQIQALLLPQQNIQEIERICQEYAPQQLQQCKSKLLQKQQQQDSDVVQECQEQEQIQNQKWQNYQQQQQQQQNQEQELQQLLQQQTVQQQQPLQIQQLQQLQQLQQAQQLQQHQQQLCLLPRQLCKEERKLCIEVLERSNINRQSAQKACEKTYELCKQSVTIRQQVQVQLNSLNEGKTAAISMGVLMRGRQESEERRIETHFSVSHKSVSKGLDQLHSTMKTVMKTPEIRQPFTLDLEGQWEMKRPAQKWNLEEILNEDLTNKVFVHGVYGYKGEQKKSLKASIILTKSENHKNFVQSLTEYKKCAQEQTQGRILTHNCKKSRHYAATLDVTHTKLSIPRQIVQNNWVKLASEGAKLITLPYLTQQTIAQRETGSHQEYDILTKIHVRDETMSVKISGNGEEIQLRGVRLGKTLSRLLPLCTRETLVHKVVQRLTGYNTPSTCTVEAGKVSTFDKLEYSYPLNNCEHVVFAEQANNPRVVVTTKKDQVKQHVKMIVDGHKFEVEIKKQSRYARGSEAVIKINGQEKKVVSLEQQIQQQNQQRQGQQQLLQQQGQQQLLQQQAQQQLLQQQGQQQEFQLLQQNVYEDQDTFVSSYVDGAYSILSRKYQIEVIADGQRLEVRSPQHIFRNRVTGMCGDLNGEWSADMKTAKQCIVTKPKLSAFSFMLEDGKCQGIPQQEKSKLQRQEQRCIRQEMIPTKVSQIFRQYQESRVQPEQRQLIEEHNGKLCFSKQLVRLCSHSYPKQVKSKQVAFACVSGPKAEIFKKRVHGGDFVEELERIPTEYTKTIHEPRQC